MNRKISIITIITLFLLNAVNAFAQTNRGVGNIKVKTDGGQTKEIKIYDGSYALVIGESDYTNGWDKLPGVKTDVAEVRAALERQGFNVESEINLTGEAFKTRVDRFINNYGYGANNRLLIYFAGHGHTQKSNDGRDLGYIIPVDAPLPEKDDIGFRRKAISMDTIQAYARQIEAKHALFVFDSCFSGKLISRDKITIPPVIQENVAYPVRQFITAGAANQSVPDDSVFRKAFVRGLDGEADRNNDGYITGSELADYLKEKVTNSTDRVQTPQYGKIRDIDLDKGDFVFTVIKGIKIEKSKPKGVALIIGNREYLNIPTLKNTINDAFELKKKLQSVGFEVIDGGINVSKKELDLLLLKFSKKLRENKGAGLFFFAGHGVLTQNINYLLPIDFSKPESYDRKIIKESLEAQTLNAEKVLTMMADATDQEKIMIIDTPLNDPFDEKESKYASLSFITRMPMNTFVAYSTKVGDAAADGAGNNSPFVEVLLNKISIKNLDLTDMFRQISVEVPKNTKGQSPWFLSNLEGKFYFDY